MHADLRLEHRDDGRLWLVRGDAATPVRAVPCFPWSHPRTQVSLRDDDDVEHALVGDPAELGPASRDALEGALAQAGFVLEIERVLAVHEEVEIRTWEVLTRQGPRTFQTAVDAWPRELPGGALVIRDVAGDLYVIHDVAAMDEGSRRCLWAFVG